MEPLSESLARSIYRILVEYAGASPDAADETIFAYQQSHRTVQEYRFIGNLGFGGKFWRTSGGWSGLASKIVDNYPIRENLRS